MRRDRFHVFHFTHFYQLMHHEFVSPRQAPAVPGLVLLHQRGCHRIHKFSAPSEGKLRLDAWRKVSENPPRVAGGSARPGLLEQPESGRHPLQDAQAGRGAQVAPCPDQYRASAAQQGLVILDTPGLNAIGERSPRTRRVSLEEARALGFWSSQNPGDTRCRTPQPELPRTALPVALIFVSWSWSMSASGSTGR